MRPSPYSGRPRGPPHPDTGQHGGPAGVARIDRARPPPYRRAMAAALPTSRLARTSRFGGLVAGQGLRWAGTQAANGLRSPERAEAATGERAAALARELVEQLGHMRGAAMKIGQVLSTVDFTAIPAAEREAFKQTLASLRDDVPPLPFARVEKLVRS